MRTQRVWFLSVLTMSCALAYSLRHIFGESFANGYLTGLAVMCLYDLVTLARDRIRRRRSEVLHVHRRDTPAG